MQIDKDTIRSAFRRFGEIYEPRGWKVNSHAQHWQRAKLAFESHSFADFNWLYEQLRRYWQVFRGSRTHWSLEEAFRRLMELTEVDGPWSIRALRDVDDAGLPSCWSIITRISQIKRTKYGPSVVATSKFLHFWNPRLFPIIDDAVMWRWVFAHTWLRDPVVAVRDRIRNMLEGQHLEKPGNACDLLSYVAVIRWSADLMRDNPAITDCFAEYVRETAPEDADGLHLEEYDAAAMEWLLLGLVELPPAGTRVPTVM